MNIKHKITKYIKESYAGPLFNKLPPELLHMPPIIEAPIQDEPIMECGSLFKGLSFSSNL